MEWKVPSGLLKFLTYQDALLSNICEFSEKRDWVRVQATGALGACHIEQHPYVHGRCTLGWLLKGLEEPLFHVRVRNEKPTFSLTASSSIPAGWRRISPT